MLIRAQRKHEKEGPRRNKKRTQSDDAFQRERDCFVNCSVSDKYDWPARRIIPPMFHYTVNHHVCPEALARKPIDSFSSTEPNRFRRSLYKGITIIHCLITFPGVCELVNPGRDTYARERDVNSVCQLVGRFPPIYPRSGHGNHIAICFTAKAINRRWANSVTHLHKLHQTPSAKCQCNLIARWLRTHCPLGTRLRDACIGPRNKGKRQMRFVFVMKIAGSFDNFNGIGYEIIYLYIWGSSGL